jgi:hypothetical protein
MTKRWNLKIGEIYTHVNKFDDSETKIRFEGETNLSKYTITIMEGKEKGCRSFLIGGDIIL